MYGTPRVSTRKPGDVSIRQSPEDLLDRYGFNLITSDNEDSDDDCDLYL
ncbi:hypothetical protein BWQ96_07742 [Gracilariopsis chorda]|uniref:Uncharacterized protein n=1 Tax=Gracilariopsis chorda TaxID=448386 RepID=A0A2V3IKA7_9FLOR|nr:hypothetical protein BWQ96_07742 [Gracilariopsis chorda]|eukprot:PXF42525.1 hypothetical protein BWQ96_07742 [Gracilariopsis chorda]